MEIKNELQEIDDDRFAAEHSWLEFLHRGRKKIFTFDPSDHYTYRVEDGKLIVELKELIKEKNPFYIKPTGD